MGHAPCSRVLISAKASTNTSTATIKTHSPMPLRLKKPQTSKMPTPIAGSNSRWAASILTTVATN